MGEATFALVEWVDSCQGTGWEDRGHVDKAMVCYTVGRVTMDGENVLTLEQSWHDGDEELGTHKQYCGVMSIPRDAIKKVTLLSGDHGE